MKNVHVKLNSVLPQKKQHSARRNVFSQANWTQF